MLSHGCVGDVGCEFGGVRKRKEDTTPFKIQFREECRFDPGHPHHHSMLPLKVETTRSIRVGCAISHRDGPRLWRSAVSLSRRGIVHLRWTTHGGHRAYGACSVGIPENAYSCWLSRQSKLRIVLPDIRQLRINVALTERPARIGAVVVLIARIRRPKAHKR